MVRTFQFCTCIHKFPNCIQKKLDKNSTQSTNYEDTQKPGSGKKNCIAGQSGKSQNIVNYLGAKIVKYCVDNQKWPCQSRNPPTRDKWTLNVPNCSVIFHRSSLRGRRIGAEKVQFLADMKKTTKIKAILPTTLKFVDISSHFWCFRAEVSRLKFLKWTGFLFGKSKAKWTSWFTPFLHISDSFSILHYGATTVLAQRRRWPRILRHFQAIFSKKYPFRLLNKCLLLRVAIWRFYPFSDTKYASHCFRFRPY